MKRRDFMKLGIAATAAGIMGVKALPTEVKPKRAAARWLFVNDYLVDAQKWNSFLFKDDDWDAIVRERLALTYKS